MGMINTDGLAGTLGISYSVSTVVLLEARKSLWYQGVFDDGTSQLTIGYTRLDLKYLSYLIFLYYFPSD